MSAKVPCPLDPTLLVDAADCSSCNDEHKDAADGCCEEVTHAKGAAPFRCDGHDYHERTKEQAERDKSRDRALKRAGYDVIHFTGREIWRDPAKWAMEIRDQFRALLKPREGGRAR
jgi:hypothetical protein